MEFVRKNIVYILALATALLLFGASIKPDHDSTGTEYAPQMYHSVGYEPLSQSDSNNINPLGMNMRVPAAGSVKRMSMRDSVERGIAVMDMVARNIAPDSSGMGNAERLLSNPIANTEANIAKGKEQYERFCMHCHGETGKGDGLVGKVYAGVPVYSSDAIKGLNDGHIFYTITHGKGRMWPHGSQISAADRWKIVLYVHKLQQG